MKKIIYGAVFFAIAGIAIISCEKTETNKAEIKQELTETEIANNRIHVDPLPEGCISTNGRCTGACSEADYGTACSASTSCYKIKNLDDSYRFECWTNEIPRESDESTLMGFDTPTYPLDIHHFDILRSTDEGVFEPFLIGQLPSEYSVEGFEDVDAFFYATITYEIMCYSEAGDMLDIITWSHTK